MNHSENINEIAAALAAAQGEFKAVAKDKTATVKGQTQHGKPFEYTYQYSDIADVLEMVLPILSKHNLALIQATDVDGGAIFLRTRIVHASGQWIESEYPVCEVRAGDHQRMGGALTYARRYAASSLLGIASEEDTDAQGAAEPAGRAARSQQSAPRQTVDQKPQNRQRAVASRDPSPGERGVKAVMLHAIGLAETGADLEDWYKDSKTQEALEVLAPADKDDVRKAWAEKRNEIRAAAQGQQEAA